MSTAVGFSPSALPSLRTSRSNSRGSCSPATASCSTFGVGSLPSVETKSHLFAAGSCRELQRLWRLSSQSDGAPGSPKTENKPSADEPTPSWAKPGSEELPPWARNEAAAPTSPPEDLPFFVYLIASCLVAIAAVGSIFEFFNRNPVFGIIEPDNPLWAPILGVFAITGFPSAGFLWYKAIKLANKASEDADRADGFDR